MAQGAIKKKAKTTPSSSKRNSLLAPKRGTKVIAPKKKNLVDQKRITKNLSAGLTARTERTLAERAGHLEMLGGGKRGSKSKSKSRSSGAKTEEKQEKMGERGKKG